MKNYIVIILGTTSITVYDGKTDSVISEPAAIAINKKTNFIINIGNEAVQLYEKIPGCVNILYPFKFGMFYYAEVTEKIIEHFYKKYISKRIIKPNLILSIPIYLSKNDKNNLMDLASDYGINNVYFVPKTIADVIGVRPDALTSGVYTAISIGNEKTEIILAVQGKIISYKVINIAGICFDEAIIKYIRNKYNLKIREETAEYIKTMIGGLYNYIDEDGGNNVLSVNVKGIDLKTGLPRIVIISSVEIIEAQRNVADELIESIKQYINNFSDDIRADITVNGIYLTGGGSKLKGITNYISEAININVINIENYQTYRVLGIKEVSGKIQSIAKDSHNLIHIENLL